MSGIRNHGIFMKEEVMYIAVLFYWRTLCMFCFIELVICNSYCNKSISCRMTFAFFRDVHTKRHQSVHYCSVFFWGWRRNGRRNIQQGFHQTFVTHKYLHIVKSTAVFVVVWIAMIQADLDGYIGQLIVMNSQVILIKQVDNASFFRIFRMTISEPNRWMENYFSMHVFTYVVHIAIVAYHFNLNLFTLRIW